MPSELDQAVEYTKQFIEVMTPIAKQAYEIGLLTLRIDAAQDLITDVFVLAVCFFTIRYIRAAWVVAVAKKEKLGERHSMGANEHLPMLGIPHIFATIFAIAFGLVATFGIVNIWSWAKLFAPQLWLAHHAIEKIIK